ncbi:MAG TPA: serine hydrolase domain-containing protein [Dermatophilaceae bacterium]|nr:serine hydrolase domain-containing protein [Dermatophilaceae bacterium]
MTETTTPLPRGSVTGRTRRELERMVRAAQRDWRSPSVSAGVVVDGGLAWSAHVGSARLEPRAPATDDTAYMIGSITKTFTAVLVLMLRDEGRLALDDRLEQHLPGAHHGGVTVRALLGHVSGLQREPVGRIWETLDAPDEAQLMAGLGLAEQVLPAHAWFHYSNLAYALLGQVVQRVDRRSWEEALQARLLDPLGMRHTGLVPDEATRARGYAVHPHAATATEEPRFDLLAAAPLGGLWSSVADLARYAAFVADPPAHLLAAATMDQMCRPIVMVDQEQWRNGYGLGYELSRHGDRVLAGHGGSMPGFLSGIKVHRTERVGAVVLTNVTAGATPLDLAAGLVETVTDALPAMAPTWAPSQPDAAFDGVLGSWWSEGEELVFEVRDGQLWSRLAAQSLPRLETRFAAEGVDRFRAVQGREQGELLELVRDGDGRVVRMYFATYAFTREPATFADLADRSTKR